VLSELQQKTFFGVNYGVISMPKFVRRKLRQKMTLLRHNCFIGLAPGLETLE
jgi:hypothetical protein